MAEDLESPRDFLVFIIKLVTLFAALEVTWKLLKGLRPYVFINLLFNAGGFLIILGSTGAVIITFISSLQENPTLVGKLVVFVKLWTPIVVGLTTIAWALSMIETSIQESNDIKTNRPYLWGLLSEVFGTIIILGALYIREIAVVPISIIDLSRTLSNSFFGIEAIAELAALCVVLVVDSFYIGMLLFGIGVYTTGIFLTVSEARQASTS